MSLETQRELFQQANEVNGLSSAHEAFREEIDYSQRVDITDRRLAKIVRLRLLLPSWEERMSGYNNADVSYCWGELKDGTHVYVNVTLRIDIRKGVKAGIVAMAKQEGIYAKGLGLLDDSVISTLKG